MYRLAATQSQACISLRHVSQAPHVHVCISGIFKSTLYVGEHVIICILLLTVYILLLTVYCYCCNYHLCSRS